jgi:DNA-binding CsgD family transcriptional regulator
MTKKRYYLYDSNPAVYFTNQEARCMYHALHGSSNAEIAKAMGLSLRTIDHYFEIMRQKVGSSHKKLLIEKIIKTNFMKYIGELLILEREKEMIRKLLTKQNKSSQ